MTESWVRSQRAAVVDVGDACFVIGAGRVQRLDGDSAALARAVLSYLVRPHSEPEVIAHVEQLAGPLGERTAVVAQLLALLGEAGALARTASAGAGTSASTRAVGLNVVVGVTGAIAASHAPALIAALQRRGHTVEVALTPTAARFVAIDTLAALVQREVHMSMWPRAAHVPVPHVALASWAELVIVYPASATTIGRLASGDFSELVAAIALTTSAPVVIVPSMNDGMLDAPVVQRNLDRLRDDGHALVHGVPSQEVADAPALRGSRATAAPAPSEVVAAIEALRAAGALPRRDASAAHAATAPSHRDWDAAYRRGLVPWANDECDADLAAALAGCAATPCRVLDIGCGLGQVARHAAEAGHRVVATDVSEVALALARAPGRDSDVVWVRDDICATALIGPFDVIVDRATVHALPAPLAPAWASSIRKLAAPDASVIIKCHRDGVPGITTGWTAAAIGALLPDFAIVSELPAELPSPTTAAAIPARLVILRRAR